MEDGGGAGPYLCECCSLPFIGHPGIFGEALVEVVQGELGLSSFKAREATTKVAHENRLLRLPEQNITRRMLDHTIFAGRSTRWTRWTAALRWRFELPPVCLEKAEEAQRTRPGKGVRQSVQEKETDTWQRSPETKSSLALYHSEKLDICTEPFYDNSKGMELRNSIQRKTTCWRRFPSWLKNSAIRSGSRLCKRSLVHVCSLLPPLLRSSAAAVARDAAAEAYMVQPAIAAVAEEADLTLFEHGWTLAAYCVGEHIHCRKTQPPKNHPAKSQPLKDQTAQYRHLRKAILIAKCKDPCKQRREGKQCKQAK
ncbi:hypothetical protein HPB50_005011 [Hyalomma asiaticum]|uniref:Uncharacterized protein n=1 Tax=Hyalomma asiaticum TaxID=266040 RepID=A0ACB7SMM1_HYAAI|nr:hypothetical protein HPB50_005011 [Hyalomma asiaticum]